MPDMIGWDLLAAIKRGEPAMPSVLITGWGLEPSTERYLLFICLRFCRAPRGKTTYKRWLRTMLPQAKNRASESPGIKEWMLAVPGLEGICRDYLDLITEMKSGQHDREIIQYLDSQRQVAHDQILGYLDLDRADPLDVEAFAKRYLGQL